MASRTLLLVSCCLVVCGCSDYTAIDATTPASELAASELAASELAASELAASELAASELAGGDAAQTDEAADESAGADSGSHKLAGVKYIPRVSEQKLIAFLKDNGPRSKGGGHQGAGVRDHGRADMARGSDHVPQERAGLQRESLKLGRAGERGQKRYILRQRTDEGGWC